MLSSLTIILPSMTTFFCTAAALNDYYLLFCLFYVSQFFVLFLPSCVTIYVTFCPALRLFFLFVIALDQFCIVFRPFFIISLCVVSLFCLFFFSLCHSVNSPLLSTHVFPPHLITKYSLESMFTPKRTKYPKHYAKKIIKTVSTNTLNPSTIYKDPSHSQQPKPKITSMKLFSLA